MAISTANKELVREFFEKVLGEGRVDLMPDYMTEGYRMRIEGEPGTLDLAQHTEFVAMFRQAFPDWEEDIVEMIAEDDTVVTRVHGTGTHLGEYRGIPATGRRITVASINLDRIVDGRIAERWLLLDMLGAMLQLGMQVQPEAGDEPAENA